jgi:Protein of unknown function (DUF2852)
MPIAAGLLMLFGFWAWWPLFLIGLLLFGFWAWWPLGLLALAFMIWSTRMGTGCWSHCGNGHDRSEDRWDRHMNRWQSKMERVQEKMDRLRDRMEGSRGAGDWWGRPRSSGNRAFDDYRAETLRRLEDEQREFKDFLERLRFAKDRAEFDQFMAERRNRPPGEPTQPPSS